MEKTESLPHRSWRDESQSKKEELCVTMNGWMNGEWVPSGPSSSPSGLSASSPSVPWGQQDRPLTSETHILDMALWPQTTGEMV